MSAAQGVVYRCARAMSTRRVKLRLAGVSSAANENEMRENKNVVNQN